VLNPRRRGVDTSGMAGWRASCSVTRARRLTSGAMGLTVAWWAIAGPAWGDLTDIALTPESGAVGSDVTISGDNCRKSGQEPSSVHVLAPTLGVDLTITPEPNGSWSGDFSVPSEAIEGPHVLVATCTRNASVVPYVPVMFTVTGVPVTVTTSSVGTTVAPPTTAAAPGPAATAPPSTDGSAGGPASSLSPPSPSAVTTADSTSAPVLTPGSTALPGQSTTTASENQSGAAPSTQAGRVSDSSSGTAVAAQNVSSSSGTGPTWYLLALFTVGAPAYAWWAWRRSRARRTGSGLDRSASERVRVEAGAQRTDTSLLVRSPANETIESAPIALLSVDIGDRVRAMEGRIRAGVGPDVSVQLDVDPQACFTLLGADDLDRLILPLVDNAARALPDSGMIRIATGRGPCASAGASERDLDWALIVVADTGPGIPTEVVIRLREAPSDPAEPADPPTGLTNVHSIVVHLGGHLDVSSVAGHGTTVTIALPLLDAPPEPLVVADIDELEASTTT
jgi:hypothetical protein